MKLSDETNVNSSIEVRLGRVTQARVAKEAVGNLPTTIKDIECSYTGYDSNYSGNTSISIWPPNGMDKAETIAWVKETIMLFHVEVGCKWNPMPKADSESMVRHTGNFEHDGRCYEIRIFGCPASNNCTIRPVIRTTTNYEIECPETHQ